MPTGPVTTVLDGLGLLESPRWHEGELLVADWTHGRIHALRDGKDRVVLEHRSLPLCFAVEADGSLLVVSGTESAVLRCPPGGAPQSYADLAGLSLGGWNEIVLDRRGGAYVNSGNFDPSRGFPTSPTGLVVHVAANGAVGTVATDLAFPNGMALTAGGGTLLVAESHAGRIAAFDVAADGGLVGRRVWADLGDAAPDGICLDAFGACWYADVPHAAVVRVAEGGEELDRVRLPQGAFSCCLDDDGTTLYVAAATWPGGARLLDPDVVWDGTVYAVPLG